MRFFVVGLMALALSPQATAATTYPAINAVLSEATKRPVQAVCYTPDEWAIIGARDGFNPVDVLGFVIRRSYDGGATWTPDAFSHHAPDICERTEGFRVSPTRETQKLCQDGYDQVPRTGYRLEDHVRYEDRIKYVLSKRWVVVVQHGKRAKVLRPYRKRVTYRVRIIYTVEVPYTVYDQVPRIIVCADWSQKTKALHVMIHEAAHMAGWADEQQADCWAMSSLDWFAWRLGASPDFAREVQADEWVTYSQHPYFLPSCPA